MKCLCAHEFADCPLHPLLNDDERLTDQEDAHTFAADDDDWVEPDDFDVAEHFGFPLSALRLPLSPPEAS